MLSKEEALEIARAECERRGHAFAEPVFIRRGPFRTVILTNADVIGGNCRIRINSRTGAITYFWFVSR
jgi:hypothetical protein